MGNEALSKGRAVDEDVKKTEERACASGMVHFELVDIALDAKQNDVLYVGERMLEE